MMVPTVSLMALIMLSWVPFSQVKNEGSPPYYKLTPLTQNPGIYYEYMGEVKIERVKWKIVVTLDFTKWNDPITWREKQMFKMITTCNDQLNLHIFFVPSLVVPDNSFIPYTHALSKREAPLEFIGCTSRQLFGTMDAGDRDQSNQDVDKLYERTDNMSTLLASQTHILANRTKQLNNFASRSTTVQTLLEWVNQFDQSLEHSINSYKTLVNTIETATRSYLHQLLFIHEQLQSTLEILNRHTLPWEHSTVTVEMLHAMSKVSVNTVGGKLVLILEFPLSDKARYSQYKIHPLPIPQEIMTNATSYVTLVPQYSHLIVLRDMQNYLLTIKEYIDTCGIHRKVSMCSPSLLFNIDNDNSPGDFALLARPTQATLRTYKLAISTTSTPYWGKLRSTDEWLYSLRYVNSVVNVIQANETYLYNPGLKFDLKFSTDSIMNAYDSFNEVTDITNADKQQIRKWAESDDAITLQQLEDKFTEIAAQKREKYLYTSYISSAAISPIIIITLIIIVYSYCARKSNRSRKNKAKTVENTKDENFELPTARPLLAYSPKQTPCNIEEITTNFNTPQSLPAETVIHIPPMKIPSCTQLAVYQAQESAGSNQQLTERGRISSINSLNGYVRPLPIQGNSLQTQLSADSRLDLLIVLHEQLGHLGRPNVSEQTIPDQEKFFLYIYFFDPPGQNLLKRRPILAIIYRINVSTI
ncbi:hypothetical protein TSAR_011165 [Trichomalopsis sarcophagae]|uniref:Envelope fusion protein n=1 Tax=Trichomalopsis sarcophagae TaxID=543379 RepID=A0A232EPZ0_9HYME|nr:hypothetical protein TSAR_011165 [Trichomalopsis sarcophagae]